MYAIVEIAGQQFKVEAGMEIFVNRLAAEKGAAVEFDKVLLIDEEGAVKVGAPYVEGAKVTATVLDSSLTDACRSVNNLLVKLLLVLELKLLNVDSLLHLHSLLH